MTPQPKPHHWDPQQYLVYADERGRPFVELLARVRAEGPQRVVDLGCGPGNLTRLLAERWPKAEIWGLDSSEAMIASAREGNATTIRFEVADLRDWQPATPVDVLVSNATLQWVPGHLDLLPQLVRAVVPGGWLAFQVPGNFGERSHTLLFELAHEERYAPFAAGVARPHSHDPRVYLEALHQAGCTVDAWETTYLHVLQGEDPVFAWVTGTGARPTLQALPPELRAPFEREYKRRLREAYPAGASGTVLPFRRIFVVAQTPR